MSDFLDLQGAKDLNTDAIHIGAVANSKDPVTGAAIDTHTNRAGGTDYTLQGFWNAIGPVVMPWTSVAGGTLTQPNQAFLHPTNWNYYSWTGAYPKVVAPGTDPTSAGSGYVPRTDVLLRSELAASGGAAMIGDGLATQAELNACDIRKFGAELLPFNSTSAFTSAYADSDSIYVPDGDWLTTVFYPARTFGPGRVFSTYEADGLYQDSGERPILTAVHRDNSTNKRVKTWGNYERAAGESLIVNNPSGRAQVSGFNDDSTMATYVNADHVGRYIGMFGPKDQITTTAASTTYTKTTITAPDITQAAVDAKQIRVGMFIKTKHSPRYGGRVIAVDVNTNTITVNAWYAEGNASAGQVPSDATAAVINAADKLWAQNSVVYIQSESSAKGATGYELGFYLDTTPTDVWGYHAVNYSGTAYKLDRAFYASGAWEYGQFFTKDVDTGVFHNKPPIAAVSTENLDDAAWAGSAVRLKTNYLGSTGYLLTIRDGSSVLDWSINSGGHRSTIRENMTIVTASTGITRTTASMIASTAASAITLTPSGNFRNGHIFEIRVVGAGAVTFAGTGTVILSGQLAKFIYDGTSWVRWWQGSLA